jgi:hypothetical protein
MQLDYKDYHCSEDSSKAYRWNVVVHYRWNVVAHCKLSVGIDDMVSVTMLIPFS